MALGTEKEVGKSNSRIFAEGDPDSDSVEFLKLCLRVLELPAIALQQTQPEQKGLSEGKAALDSKLRKVESLTLHNRLHAASKVLFSHGMAQPTGGLFDRLQALHPALKEPIPDLNTWRIHI